MGKTSIFPMVDGLIISILNELAHVLNDHGDMMPRKDNGQMGTSGHPAQKRAQFWCEFTMIAAG